MSNLSFCFESNPIRILGDQINPLFVALDICKALGFTNHRKAITDHVDPEDLCKEFVETKGGRQEVNCVNESGMYALIFGSKLPSAKRFKRWVTNEVLPTIRKTGHYEVANQGLNPAQQHLIRQAVSKRAKTISAHYQTIYRAIYNRYQIARYDQLPPCELNDCLKFIREVDLSVPEVVKHEQQMPTVHDNVMILSDKDLDRLRGFVYCYKYLFRKEVELFFSFLQGVRSPYAGKFYDSFTDWSLTNIEMMLEKAGYPIKTLDCYKHWEAHQKLERPF